MIDILPGKSTPRVLLDDVNGKYIIEGQSYPENSSGFFEPIIAWFNDKLEKNNSDEINLEVKLLYINTSSTKAMFYIFDLLDEAFKKGRKVKITWFYDSQNEMAKDTGEELLEDLVLPYIIVPIED